MRKIITLILALTMIFSCAVLASCGNETEQEAPSGMKRASAEEASYIFYVPSTWQCDVASGATTAYYSNSDTSSVSVMTFALENSDADAADWWSGFEADFKNVYDDFEIESREDVKLDGVDGAKVVFTGALTHDGEDKVTFKFMQVAAVRKKTLSAPEVYVVTYTSSPEVYDNHLEEVQKMLDNFKCN